MNVRPPGVGRGGEAPIDRGEVGFFTQSSSLNHFQYHYLISAAKTGSSAHIKTNQGMYQII